MQVEVDSSTAHEVAVHVCLHLRLHASRSLARCPRDHHICSSCVAGLSRLGKVAAAGARVLETIMHAHHTS
eukprot:1138156-Pelagomonas_calceolata.AAC.5